MDDDARTSLQRLLDGPAHRVLTTAVAVSAACAAAIGAVVLAVAPNDPVSASAPTQATPPATTSGVPAAVPAVLPAAAPARTLQLVVARPALLPATAVTDIPAAALAAYQRAASVIDQAAPSCHLDWTLLAAIGYVDSANGTAGGRTLSETGEETPALFGPSLDTPDSDAGALDHDKVHDRAVGPLRLTPANWSVIGVDADGDGVRDPQDIDDASLALGVQLCAQRDLSTAKGLRAGLWAVNPSKKFRISVQGAYAVYRTAPAPAPSTFPVVAAAAPMGGGAVPAAAGRSPLDTVTATLVGVPSGSGSGSGTKTPTGSPTATPTSPSPSGSPSGSPSSSPSSSPSGSPSASPSDTPSSTADSTSTPTAGASTTEP